MSDDLKRVKGRNEQGYDIHYGSRCAWCNVRVDFTGGYQLRNGSYICNGCNENRDERNKRIRNEIDIGMVLLDRVWRYLNSKWMPSTSPHYSYYHNACIEVNELGTVIYPDWVNCGRYNYSIEDWWNGKEIEV